MTIASYESGSIALGSGATSASDTLGTTVTQSNSILIVSVSGGSNTAAQQNIKVVLSSDGTTVTASRQSSGSAITVEYQVIQSTAFTVQHKDIEVSSTTQSESITSVDTDYSFIVCTGTIWSGGTRGNDNIIAIEIDSDTTCNLEIQAANLTVAFQVVEMSATEISSVQIHKVTQSTTSVDTTITSVDTGKSLVFSTAKFTAGSGATVLQNDFLPAISLTSSTNLRLTSRASSSDLITWVYVVEFVNMGVTSATSSPTGTTDTEVLGGAPTYGGAVINGIYGRYSTADDTDDDSLEGMWDASLSGSTWTFTRGASTTTADLSYSVFDWDDLFSTGSFTLTANSGTYTYTGTANELLKGSVLPAVSGSYTYTGTAASLIAGAQLAADSGTYAYTGTAAVLVADRLLTADSGAYTYTGTAATLTFTPAGVFTLTADSGSYSYTGTAAQLLLGSVIQTDAGTYVYTGTSADLRVGFTLAANSGTYSYTGTNVTLSQTRILTAISGAYSYTGSNVVLNFSGGSIWTEQSDSVTSWADQADSVTTWTPQ